jgi:Na+/H+ antiporter NhaD/arsenite permease-like protein
VSKFLYLGLIFIPTPLYADGSLFLGYALSVWWALPFVGMLLSLALLPLFAHHFWEAHYGKVALGWALLTFISLSLSFGLPSAKDTVLQTFFHHYLPFIIMIGSLYTLAGGIHIDVSEPANPFVNTILLAIGTFLAGWIGTTGAAMVLIRPFLHMNRERQYRVHQMIFFIFLIGNIGGALTPLGDPPLFIGFLNGVNFFWPLKHLSFDMGWIILTLLVCFYGLDFVLLKKEGTGYQNKWPKVTIKGLLNGILFLGVICCILFSSLWKSNDVLKISGISFDVQEIIRDGGLIFLALISFLFTPQEIRTLNRFSWEPLKEVAKLFFGIFVTVIPVIAILDAGHKGAFAPLISLVNYENQPQNHLYFWLSGGLSSILDNAPTYLVFFHLAGGNAATLMTSLSQTLVAISLGSVFMGALTYIGNAPNFMIKTIAESHKIPMPGFFGYMAWSLGILLPLFLLLSWLRF